jgi:hypothetical protein
VHLMARRPITAGPWLCARTFGVSVASSSASLRTCVSKTEHNYPVAVRRRRVPCVSVDAMRCASGVKRRWSLRTIVLAVCAVTFHDSTVFHG